MSVSRAARLPTDEGVSHARWIERLLRSTGRSTGLRLRGRGRGPLSFALGICGYHRAFAGAVLTNEPSWKLMERVGMRKEAHFREAHVPAEPGGPWIDSVRYAVLASEWPVHPAN